MLLKNKILTLSKLSEWLTAEQTNETLSGWAAMARNKNGWFTEDNVQIALNAIAQKYLSRTALENFANLYDLKDISQPKKVGIVAAGNIPLVGLADLLHVVLAGHKVLIKLSSNDAILMQLLIKKLFELDQDWKNEIEIADKLNAADAFIATGSDNTARYFEYYFSKKPNIIRKNRSSVAILNGAETSNELRNLGNDIFTYFGLGCRNVAKLYVPENYQFEHFFESIEYWNTIRIHHKYNNNYDYNKSVYLINKVPHFDNGFLLLTENPGMISPLTVVYYEKYQSEEHLNQLIEPNKDKIQVIIGHTFNGFPSLPFGESQTPGLADFADGIDTMAFLKQLN